MASHANDKLVSALSQLAEAYAELQEELEEKFNSGEREEDDDFEDEENDDEEALAEEVDAAMVSELKLAIDSVIDSDDVATEEFAAIFRQPHFLLQKPKAFVFSRQALQFFCKVFLERSFFE